MVLLKDQDSIDLMSVILQAKKLSQSHKTEEALDLLKRVRGVEIPDSCIQPASKLAGLLSESLPDLPIISIAFGAYSTVDSLVGCLRWHLLTHGLRLSITIIPFGTWHLQAKNPNSAIYDVHHDFIWLFPDERLLKPHLVEPLNKKLADEKVEEILRFLVEPISNIQEKCKSQIIVSNYVQSAWRVFGNHEKRVIGSMDWILSRVNERLEEKLLANVVLFDINYLASSYGLIRWHDEKLKAHSKHPFSLGAHSFVAQAMRGLLLASLGMPRKCIVLDLDNTLWGGVIGDDGLKGILIGPNGGAVGESFYNFQSWLLALNRRGVILAVCSKNNEEIAKRPFLELDSMLLKLDDIAAFSANWQNKADNIRDIAKVLNLGLDSFVFVDDNPAERDLIRTELPEVLVPDMAIDPSQYIEKLSQGRYFESIGISNEDLIRSHAYQINKRLESRCLDSSDLPSYLRGLEMRSIWGEVDEETLPRAAQLIKKTNQFQLTGKRYSETELSRIIKNDRFWVGHFSLSDKYGNHGITSIAILEFDSDKAFIDVWVMSCRVFSRSFENFIFNILVDKAKERGLRFIYGTYVPSNKNAVVSSLLDNLGGVTNMGLEGGVGGVRIFDVCSEKIYLETYVNV
jgi:FkbH-like protein